MAKKLGLPIIPIYYTPQPQIEACLAYPNHDAVAAANLEKEPLAARIPPSWVKITAQGTALDPDRCKVYSEVVSSSVRVPSQGDDAAFEADFWGYSLALATCVGRHIPDDTSFHVAFCCANVPEQVRETASVRKIHLVAIQYNARYWCRCRRF